MTYPLEIAFELIQQSIKNGGGTFDINTLEPVEFDTGYLVSAGTMEHKYPLSALDTKAFTEALNAIITWSDDSLTAGQTQWYLGTWIHENHIYIEPSQHVEEVYEAAYLALSAKQLSIYDCKLSNVIFI